MPRSTLLYDEDCGFCRWATDRILSWDRAGALRAAPIQGREGSHLLADIPLERRLESWHLVAADGTVRSGGAAVAPLATMLPHGAPVAALAAAAPRTTNRAYRAIARHRGALGRVVGVRACAVEPRSRTRSAVE
jgi:predicted DCC family thiol-disulfide oxidoreductase YuxK